MKIGVLNSVRHSQYGNPIFITPKKEGTVRFITDYHSFKHKLVRKAYPLPRIGETMQQMEGFQYVNSLDLNMGYYNLRLLPVVSTWQR